MDSGVVLCRDSNRAIGVPRSFGIFWGFPLLSASTEPSCSLSCCRSPTYSASQRPEKNAIFQCENVAHFISARLRPKTMLRCWLEIFWRLSKECYKNKPCNLPQICCALRLRNALCFLVCRVSAFWGAEFLFKGVEGLQGTPPFKKHAAGTRLKAWPA